ncbi:MAG: 30S ribosomal protein S2 [Actinomycetia bacterium]|nr:30S ribosomal protein S2 [Actinomycetes bacterium]
MAVVSMRELLEAGVHFGHQTRRWNPKMRRYIFSERGGIYIIDLQQTLALIEEAHKFVRNVAERGGTVLFVGTKKQAQDVVKEEAQRVDMPYVNHRWLGGLLTNWRTISERIARLHDLRRLRDDQQLELLPAKERMAMLSELEKLETNLGGVAEMRAVPDALVLVDLKKEALAVREARRLDIPVIGLVDTNCDPDEVTYVIPGNDDAIRSCSLVVRVLADGVAAGAAKVSLAELKAEAQAAAQAEAAAAAQAEADPAPAATDKTHAAQEDATGEAAAAADDATVADAAAEEDRGEAPAGAKPEPETQVAPTPGPAEATVPPAGAADSASGEEATGDSPDEGQDKPPASEPGADGADSPQVRSPAEAETA